HTIIGARIPGMFSKERHVYAMLNNILAGPGMNSLLNVKLREKRGLVYSVESSTSVYTDSAALTIYYGCDPDDNKKCLRLVTDTLRHLADKPLSPRGVQKAQRQYLGQLIVARDNREQVILSTARSAFFYGNILTSSEIVDRINSITPEQLQNAAQSLLGYSSLTIK
ncbi:MAG: insulinase family protein, partial [Muribaculaceae bacterium]|nr:insulinase family protein [Muribaculaceae bacterium]